MPKKNIFFFLTSFAFSILSNNAWACPFCSENLARNSGGYSGGLSLGIVITIFFMLGAIGSVAGFVAYLMIKEGKKSDRRHELAQASSQTLRPSEVR